MSSRCSPRRARSPFWLRSCKRAGSISSKTACSRPPGGQSHPLDQRRRPAHHAGDCPARKPAPSTPKYDAHAAEDCAQAPCKSRWALWPGPPLMNATGEQAWVLYLLLNDDHPSGVGVGLWSGLDQPVEEGGASDRADVLAQNRSRLVRRRARRLARRARAGSGRVIAVVRGSAA